METIAHQRKFVNGQTQSLLQQLYFIIARPKLAGLQAHASSSCYACCKLPKGIHTCGLHDDEDTCCSKQSSQYTKVQRSSSMSLYWSQTLSLDPLMPATCFICACEVPVCTQHARNLRMICSATQHKHNVQWHANATSWHITRKQLHLHSYCLKT